tara:strand:+ start:94 stop:306 length:213 start_codon:yes stop_codon:yes gene_type:complete
MTQTLDAYGYCKGKCTGENYRVCGCCKTLQNIYEALANIEDLCSCGMEGCKQITIKRLEQELNKGSNPVL